MRRKQEARAGVRGMIDVKGEIDGGERGSKVGKHACHSNDESFSRDFI